MIQMTLGLDTDTCTHDEPPIEEVVDEGCAVLQLTTCSACNRVLGTDVIDTSHCDGDAA